MDQTPRGVEEAPTKRLGSGPHPRPVEAEQLEPAHQSAAMATVIIQLALASKLAKGKRMSPESFRR